MHFQKATRRTLGWLLVLAFLAAAALQGDPLARASEFSLNGLYVGALVAAYALWLWSRRARYQTKYLDYRALAEGLRVQIFWRLAGISDAAADSPPPSTRETTPGGARWFRSWASRPWPKTRTGSCCTATARSPSPARSSGPRYPLTLPAVSPSTMYFCR